MHSNMYADRFDPKRMTRMPSKVESLESSDATFNRIDWHTGNDCQRGGHLPKV